MVASRRQDVWELNRLARASLLVDGTVAADGVTIGGRVFAVGDQVVCLRNDRRLGVHNGLFADVTHIDPDDATLTIDADGKEFSLPASYIEAGRLSHAYATTIHKAQGVTVDRTLVLGSDDLYRQAVYVGLSRGRDRNDLYIARELADEDEWHGVAAPEERVDRLAASFSRDGSKLLAMDEAEGPTWRPDTSTRRSDEEEVRHLTAMEVRGVLSEHERTRRTELIAALDRDERPLAAVGDEWMDKLKDGPLDEPQVGVPIVAEHSDLTHPLI